MVKVVAFQYMEENYKMKKPYIICHRMTSVDGRIDCAMTEQFPSVFDSLKNTHPLIHLKLLDVKRFKSDAIWLYYKA